MTDIQNNSRTQEYIHGQKNTAKINEFSELLPQAKVTAFLLGIKYNTVGMVFTGRVINAVEAL